MQAAAYCNRPLAENVVLPQAQELILCAMPHNMFVYKAAPRLLFHTHLSVHALGYSLLLVQCNLVCCVDPCGMPVLLRSSRPCANRGHQYSASDLTWSPGAAYAAAAAAASEEEEEPQ
jgi:hypothetical protein